MTSLEKRRPSPFFKILTYTLLILSLWFLLEAFVAISANPSMITDRSVLYLLVMGGLGLLLASYGLLVMRRQPSIWQKLAYKPATTVVECTNQQCGFKNVRRFRKGDYVFKEEGVCPQCSSPMMISAIYVESEEKAKLIKRW